jgi:hypothetical protein
LHAISPTTTKQLIMRLKAPGPRMSRLRLALMRGVCFDTHAVLEPETVYQFHIPLVDGFEVLDMTVAVKYGSVNLASPLLAFKSLWHVLSTGSSVQNHLTINPHGPWLLAVRPLLIESQSSWLTVARSPCLNFGPIKRIPTKCQQCHPRAASHEVNSFSPS